MKYVSRFCLLPYCCNIFRPLHFVYRGLQEVLVMLDTIVGLIGVILIIYLLISVIKPELF
jgi:hypothetical protein